MYRRIGAFQKQKRLSRQRVWWQEMQQCLLWWGIGLFGGILFSIMLDEGFRQMLVESVENGIRQGVKTKAGNVDFLVKQTYQYGKLFLLIWLLGCWKYGAWGIRIILVGLGFLQAYAHTVWVFAYGWHGLWLGLGMQWPQNLLVLLIVCGMNCLSGWLLGVDKKTAWTIRGSIAVLAAFGVAVIQTYGAPAFFKWVDSL